MAHDHPASKPPTSLRVYKRLDDMTKEEMIDELLIHPWTRIWNRRAWGEMDKGPAQAMISADGVDCRQEEGDRHLRAIADALEQAMPGRVAHLFGEIFAAHAASAEEREAGISRAKGLLSRAKTLLHHADGTAKDFTGMGFSYGYGPNSRAADYALVGNQQGMKNNKGFAQPVGSRLRDQVEPLLKQGYTVTKVQVPQPDGTIKEY